MADRKFINRLFLRIKDSIKKLCNLVSYKKERDYIQYWDSRYKQGRNSGKGSRGDLARYKADYINNFIREKKIGSIIEFGCGDGYQLKLSKYPKYLGLDVAKSSVEYCSKYFYKDNLKSFMLYEPSYFSNKGYLHADLVLCLDVLYHIINKKDFEKTISDIFDCADKYVIIYTNLKSNNSNATHIIFRDTLNYLHAVKDFKIQKLLIHLTQILAYHNLLSLKKYQKLTQNEYRNCYHMV
jgi:SAM-dependent methyltransferase